MPPPPPRSTLFPYTTLFRSHLQHGQLLAPVAAVLHQEAVQALLLGDVHQGPQLVQLGGDRRFDADVLAAPQRGRRLGVVLLPGGGDVDEVDRSEERRVGKEWGGRWA